MTPETTTPVRRPPSVRGVPPRYQIFDRRKSPPQTVGRFYADPARGTVVFDVYDDIFREFLKRTFEGRRFDWVLDVEPDAPHDTRAAIVRPHPLPPTTSRGEGEPLALEEALEAVREPAFHRVVRTSDPV